MNKDGFYVYVPSATPAAVPRCGKPVAQLTHERVLRIRQREADAKVAFAAAAAAAAAAAVWSQTLQIDI